MSTRPLTVIRETPSSRPARQKRRPERDVLRDELREKATLRLRQVTGDPMAELHYSNDYYAKFTVVQYGYKLVGWPTKIAYTGFNNLSGGIPTLRKLLALWDAGTLCFEPATPEDIANAHRDPKTVRPDYEPAKKDAHQPPTDVLVVESLVLRPGSLDVLGSHPTCTQPSALAKALGSRRPSGQRTDIKRPRQRHFTSTYNRPHMLPKAGVKSDPYILNSDIEDEAGESSSGPSNRGMSRSVNDPLLEFRPIEKIDGLYPISTWAFTPDVYVGETEGAEEIDERPTA